MIFKGKNDRLALVGDIGGTNARFGLVDLDAPRPAVTDATGYLCRDYPRAIDAIQAYLRERGLKCNLAGAVIAVAGPVQNGAIDFTNSDWTLSEAELRAAGFGAARLLNDYAALALAAPMLGEGDLRTLGPSVPGTAKATVAVIGPGTGFGVSAVARDGLGEAAMATEGGHVGFAPTDETEIEVLRHLMRKYGRVSVERILSGPGLVDLHECLMAIDGRPTSVTEPSEITRAALDGQADSLRTVQRFCAILGCVAGDYALGFGALGGVYIAGGIPPLIIDILARSEFRRRFEAKGRFQPYLAGIPTRVIIRPHAALMGAAHGLGPLLKAG